MKRTIVFILSILIVISCISTAPASAYVPETIAEKGYLYADKFFEDRDEEGIAELMKYHYDVEYKELYYHHDDEGAIDWVLVQGNKAFTYSNWSEVCSRFGPYFLLNGQYEYTFTGSLGVYDVKRDQFFDVTNDPVWPRVGGKHKYADYREFDGFIEGLESVEWPSNSLYCIPAGDLDGDNELTIIDATLLQRWLAELEYPRYTKLDRDLIADFDDDGDVTILDATAIQRHLAGMLRTDWYELPAVTAEE